MFNEWYSLFDEKSSDRCREGARRIDPADALKLNREGYGIFWAVNEFSSARQISNLVRIRSWFVDMEGESKYHQVRRLQSGLVPSMVVETKRGYHAYFFAKDAQMDSWAEIQSRLINFYQGDPNAKDVTRILRVPGFKHMKDPSDPFLVKMADEHPETSYTAEQMLEHYKAPSILRPKFNNHKSSPTEFSESSPLWDRVYAIDCADALMRLSGSAAVNFETYELVPQANGNQNIWVNGKSTSTFVDPNGRIGSSDGGGPTIWNWVNWYQHDHKKTYQILKHHFPEIFENLVSQPSNPKKGKAV